MADLKKLDIKSDKKQMKIKLKIRVKKEEKDAKVKIYNRHHQTTQTTH